MKTYRRAIGTVAAGAVVASSLLLGDIGSAEAQPVPPTARSVGQRPQPPALLELVPIQLPVLSGSGVVGSSLSVSSPLWNLPGVSTTFQWLREGAPIPGATGSTYLPSLGDAGHQLSVLATGTLGGRAPLGVLTNSIAIALPGNEVTTPTATAPPKVTGEPKVGKVVSATAPTWSIQGVANTYQWQRAGDAIAGATAATYTVTPDDVAKAISVKVTGTRTGFNPGVATSAPVTGLLGDPLTASTPPSISGAGQIGSLLSVNPGGWGAATPTFTYQWLRNAAAIPGATGSTYVAQSADAAGIVTVAVSAARPGYGRGAATTLGIQIAKQASATTAALLKKQIEQGTKGLLRIVLRAGNATPSGSIRVFDGSKLIRTYQIRSTDNGTRIVRLPMLKPGKHSLKAVYAGSFSIAGSTSPVDTLRVLKKR